MNILSVCVLISLVTTNFTKLAEARQILKNFLRPLELARYFGLGCFVL